MRPEYSLYFAADVIELYICVLIGLFVVEFYKMYAKNVI